MKLGEQMFPEEANVATDLLEYPKKEWLVGSPIFGVTPDNEFNDVEVLGLGDDAR